jgi:hypothetical protein
MEMTKNQEFEHDLLLEFDGSNYGQRFLCVEGIMSHDRKRHIKMTYARGRTSSFLPDSSRFIEKLIREYGWDPSEWVVDYYMIGDWSHTAKYEDGKLTWPTF